MIAIDLPALMECDTDEGCKESHGRPASLTVKLVLNAGGTLCPRLPTGNGWQIGVAQNGVFLTRCPKHHSVIEQPKLGILPGAPGPRAPH